MVRDEDGKTLVTDEQEKILFSYGFRYMKGRWKNLLEEPTKPLNDKSQFDESEPVNMYFDVFCNQEDVEEFLFQNHVPFLASEEYDTSLVAYDGKSDYYETFLNTGRKFLIYGFDNEGYDDMMKRETAKQRPWRRIRISDGEDITEESFGGKEQ